MTIDELQAAWAVMHKDNMDVYYDLISVYDSGDCIKIACDVVNLGYTGNPWVVQHNLR